MYKRSHDFTPYTKADGQAVSDEFDAIQAALDKVPPLRDDGTGFSSPPIIPEPTENNHPVNYGMYLNGVKNVESNRVEVERLANEVKQNMQAVAANTQAVYNNTQIVLASERNVINKERLADESENMARKWASNPEDEIVLDDKYSAYHYSQKSKQSATESAQSEQNAAQSETNANNSAVFAEEKANEAQDYMQQAKQAAFRENRWIDIVDKPAFISAVNSTSEKDFATPKSVNDVYIELQNMFEIYVGVPIAYPSSQVPMGYLAMQGQAFDAFTYPILAKKYQNGRLPDLRGEFIRGWDNGRNVDNARTLLSNQGDAIRNITGIHRSTAYLDNEDAYGAFAGSSMILDSGVYAVAYTQQISRETITFNASLVVPTAHENRPRNVAFQYICLAG
ncbi:tail fiber protein [Gallibacterium salpingitidis]|uniref:tail fiber protein n=1 Tax=Gallibacterium salpingitidis TaxID=505341 RepID=UPI0012E7F140|nr:phage tail protein [Gallibacterium salpingitidis]